MAFENTLEGIVKSLCGRQTCTSRLYLENLKLLTYHCKSFESVHDEMRLNIGWVIRSLSITKKYAFITYGFCCLVGGLVDRAGFILCRLYCIRSFLVWC